MLPLPLMCVEFPIGNRRRPWGEAQCAARCSRTGDLDDGSVVPLLNPRRASPIRFGPLVFVARAGVFPHRGYVMRVAVAHSRTQATQQFRQNLIHPTAVGNGGLHAFVSRCFFAVFPFDCGGRRVLAESSEQCCLPGRHPAHHLHFPSAPRYHRARALLRPGDNTPQHHRTCSRSDRF